MSTIPPLNSSGSLQQSQTPNTHAGMIGDIQAAIKSNSLPTFLADVDADKLAELLSEWDSAPYLEILKVCDARVARPLIAALTSWVMLQSPNTTLRAKNALEVFNTPERLLVLAEAVMLKDEENKHPIRFDSLLLWNPIKNELPSPVKKILKATELYRIAIAFAIQEANEDVPNQLMNTTEKA